MSSHCSILVKNDDSLNALGGSSASRRRPAAASRARTRFRASFVVCSVSCDVWFSCSHLVLVGQGYDENDAKMTTEHWAGVETTCIADRARRRHFVGAMGHGQADDAQAPRLGLDVHAHIACGDDAARGPPLMFCAPSFPFLSPLARR